MEEKQKNVCKLCRGYTVNDKFLHIACAQAPISHLVSSTGVCEQYIERYQEQYRKFPGGSRETLQEYFFLVCIYHTLMIPMLSFIALMLHKL